MVKCIECNKEFDPRSVNEDLAIGGFCSSECEFENYGDEYEDEEDLEDDILDEEGAENDE